MAKFGVVSDVLLSVFEEPVSVPAVISGAPGAASAVVSIVTLRLPEATEMFPDSSVCFALMVACTPSLSVEAVSVTVPAAQIADVSEVAPS